MSRIVAVLCNYNIRNRVINTIRKAPDGTIVEFHKPQRTLEQNAKMWAMLTEIAASGELRDQRWTPDQWKSIFMQSLGHPVEVLPSLDGKSWFPVSLSSSRLSKEQMSEMIECMLAWGTQNGVKFADDPVAA